jgi:tetratricopeptide (TPR) repeat protein
VFFAAASGVFSEAPVDEALAAMSEVRALADGPLEEAALENIEGLLRGMRGEIDEGRRLVRKARATFADFGALATAAGTGRDEALIERYAGDPVAVERVLRRACDDLRAHGDTLVLATEVGEHAEALYELGRYDEADEASSESERLGQLGDVITQVIWRRARARLLARRGEAEKARRLAREAIELADDDLEARADAERALAEVERLLGGADEARAALERALELYERKGMPPMAQHTRRELAELRSTTAGR